MQSLVLPFLWLWDATFLRCSCRATSEISGMHGTADDNQRRNAALRRFAPESHTAHTYDNGGVEGEKERGEDEAEGQGQEAHRFWHGWNSLDCVQLIKGWQRFEKRKSMLLPANPRLTETKPIALDVATGATPLSPSGATHTDDEEGGIQMHGLPRSTLHKKRTLNRAPPLDSLLTHASLQSVLSTSRLFSSRLLPPDIYDDLYQTIRPFAFGRRTVHSESLCGYPRSSSAVLNDVSSSSTEDAWLIQFLCSHRLPFLSHLHFGFLTLNDELVQHLLSFCCGVSSSTLGHVTAISAQHSALTPASWLQTLWSAFDNLDTLELDLSFADVPRSSLNYLSSTIVLDSHLRHLTLVGPKVHHVFPPALLNVLANTQLEDVYLANGEAVTQDDLITAAAKLAPLASVARLRSLTLCNFPKLHSLLSLLGALQRCLHLTRLHVVGCVNLRLPSIVLPPAIGQVAKNNRRPPSPPPVDAEMESRPTAPSECVSSAVCPRLVHVDTVEFSRCSSFTASTLDSLPHLFPYLATLTLGGYSSKTISGTALRALLADARMPLTSLFLPGCPHIDDSAWTALAKKTRLLRLSTLNLSLPAVLGIKENDSAAPVQRLSVGNAAVRKVLSDHGIRSQSWLPCVAGWPG